MFAKLTCKVRSSSVASSVQQFHRGPGNTRPGPCGSRTADGSRPKSDGKVKLEVTLNVKGKIIHNLLRTF